MAYPSNLTYQGIKFTWLIEPFHDYKGQLMCLLYRKGESKTNPVQALNVEIDSGASSKQILEFYEVLKRFQSTLEALRLKWELIDKENKLQWKMVEVDFPDDKGLLYIEDSYYSYSIDERGVIITCEGKVFSYTHIGGFPNSKDVKTSLSLWEEEKENDRLALELMEYRKATNALDLKEKLKEALLACLQDINKVSNIMEIVNNHMEAM